MSGRIGGRFFVHPRRHPRPASASGRAGGVCHRIGTAARAVGIALGLAAGLAVTSGCTLITDFDKEIQQEDAGASQLTAPAADEPAARLDVAAAGGETDGADGTAREDEGASVSGEPAGAGAPATAARRARTPASTSGAR